METKQVNPTTSAGSGVANSNAAATSLTANMAKGELSFLLFSVVCAYISFEI